MEQILNDFYIMPKDRAAELLKQALTEIFGDPVAIWGSEDELNSSIADDIKVFDKINEILARR